MFTIEPCCAGRHLMQLRDTIKNNGTREFEGYGDLSLTELLPAILTRYTETEVAIVAPAVPDQAAEVIGKWMRQQWSRRDGHGKLNAIGHLTIIASLSRRKSPQVSQWAKDNPFCDRLTLIDRQQADTAILLPDFAITGPVNMRYGERFTATATSDRERIAELWRQYVDTKEQETGTESEQPEEEAPETQEPASEEETAPDAQAPDDTTFSEIAAAEASGE